MLPNLKRESMTTTVIRAEIVELITVKAEAKELVAQVRSTIKRRK